MSLLSYCDFVTLVVKKHFSYFTICAYIIEFSCITDFGNHHKLAINNSNRFARRCSVKKVVLKNFAKFKGKHLCQGLDFWMKAVIHFSMLKSFYFDSVLMIICWHNRNLDEYKYPSCLTPDWVARIIEAATKTYVYAWQ